MRFKVGCATDIGRKRAQNQDSIYPHRAVAGQISQACELGLFIVADGMGGHKGGEIASRMVVELMPEIISSEQNYLGPSWDPTQAMHRAIEGASRAIHEKALKTPSLQGMGTTAVAVLFKNHHATIGHVGDSRCYFLRPGAIWQATRDHSLVQEKLRAGLITRAELKTDRMKNVITRSVGFEPNVSAETYEMDVEKGDLFLLCSDGLSGLVEDSEILKLIESGQKSGQDLQEVVEKLIETANQNGGDDNISTLIIQVD